jgi:hypothetical protein
MRSVVVPLLAVIGPLNTQHTYPDERIELLAGQGWRVPQLRSVPSVGPVATAAFIATIGDT